GFDRAGPIVECLVHAAPRVKGGAQEIGIIELSRDLYRSLGARCRLRELWWGWLTLPLDPEGKESVCSEETADRVPVMRPLQQSMSPRAEVRHPLLRRPVADRP